MAIRTVKPKRKPAKHPRAAARPVARAAKGADFVALAAGALRRRDPDAISDAQLQKVFAAAVKLYAAKMERHGGEVKPFRDGAVTTTESVVAACALIRAADLNLFDVAMWFNRPPAIS
jgi:hypothetical protein